VLVDGPSKTKGKDVPRHAAPLSSIALTHIVIPKLPLAIGHAALKSKWAEAEVEKKWKESTFAKSREMSAKRRALNDFERFKVMRLRKRVSSPAAGIGLDSEVLCDPVES
jgi:large subunit ribosomal protein L14e